MKETMSLGKFRGFKIGNYDLLLVVFHLQSIDDDT